MKMKIKWSLLLTVALACIMLFSASAFAFNDLPKGTDKDKVLELKEKGILSGNGKSFFGSKKLTYAEGVHMIVKGMDLNLAAFLFIKAPEATDYFDKVPNNAWYAESFVIAGAHDLGLPRNVDPKADMTREAYTHYLFTAMMKKGDFPFTKRLFSITDEKDVNADYMASLQLMLNAGIAKLDEKGRFLPKKAITKLEAAVMLYDTIKFVESHTQSIPQDGISVEDVTYTVEKVNNEVNKVTLSWGEKPNPGYRLEITKITFGTQGTATISYKQLTPEPGQMYAAVITTPTAVTYLSSAYQPEIQLEQ